MQPRIAIVDSSDRRISKRFPIELPAELHINNVQLRETTLNISSAGTLMTCSREGVAVGMRVKVCISWPPVREKTKMMLMRRGRIVRCQSGRIAIAWKRSKSLTLTALGKTRARRSSPRPRRLSVIGIKRAVSRGANAATLELSSTSS